MNYTEIEKIIYQKLDEYHRKERTPMFVILDRDSLHDFLVGCPPFNGIFDHMEQTIMGLTIAHCKTREDGERIIEVR